MAKIFLDAGHNYSGGDTGASGNGLLEQNITWEITSRVANLLRSSNQTAIESRPTLQTNIGMNVSQSINGRVAMANNANVDIVVCIHCNAFADISANGTEIWICSAGGRAEKLANAILPQIVNQIGTFNRGVKVNNHSYGILTGTNAPAVLIETAFITNAQDSQKLLQYDKMANAIFVGIMNYLQLPILQAKPAPVIPPQPAPASPAPAPQPSPVSFAPGNKVQIKSTATQYSRSTVKIGANYKGKTYTIQQVGNDDVLIKELVSWVKKVDIQKV